MEPQKLERTYKGDYTEQIKQDIEAERKDLEKRGYYVVVNDPVKIGDTGESKITIELRTVSEFLLDIGKTAANSQDEIFNREFKDQVGQLQALKDINTVLDAVNTAKAGGTQLRPENQKLLKELKDSKKISYDDKWDISNLDAEKLETLRGQLTTAQSSQSATNEEASMKLNEAANSRSAIFTQLNTLLQTLMQVNQTLARW